ncbi:MAG: YraN family protein [Gammaproteobacteria bacterium]|nr:YraN family protein [Gammaproteobacteria bacterium]
MFASRNKGMLFEKRAEDFLRRRGLQLVRRNFHCRFGEIDLIMRDGATLCFVEVKYRRSRAFGGAAWSLPPGKQRRIVAAAALYLQTLRGAEPATRFDALLIQRQADGSETFDWIRNAFDAGSF